LSKFVIVGTLAALGAGNLSQHVVEGMQPTGPSPYAITISLLVATAVFVIRGEER
jgi:hypothetical protein